MSVWNFIFIYIFLFWTYMIWLFISIVSQCCVYLLFTSILYDTWRQWTSRIGNMVGKMRTWIASIFTLWVQNLWHTNFILDLSFWVLSRKWKAISLYGHQWPNTEAHITNCYGASITRALLKKCHQQRFIFKGSLTAENRGGNHKVHQDQRHACSTQKFTAIIFWISDKGLPGG